MGAGWCVWGVMAIRLIPAHTCTRGSRPIQGSTKQTSPPSTLENTDTRPAECVAWSSAKADNHSESGLSSTRYLAKVDKRRDRIVPAIQKLSILHLPNQRLCILQSLQRENFKISVHNQKQTPGTRSNSTFPANPEAPDKNCRPQAILEALN